MANGPPPNRDHGSRNTSHLYDIFDQQLQLPIVRQPSHHDDDLDPYPLHDPTFSTTHVNIQQDNTRKRQRRPTAGNLVVNAFFNRAAATAGTIASVVPPGVTSKAPKKKQSTAQPRPQIAIAPRAIGPVYEVDLHGVARQPARLDPPRPAPGLTERARCRPL